VRFIVVARRRQVHHARCQSGQPCQGPWPIQIALQGRDASLPQRGQSLGRRRQRQQARPALQRLCHPQPHVAAAHDQDAFAAKARRQRAEGTLD
jgi:hypothetical protein